MIKRVTGALALWLFLLLLLLAVLFLDNSILVLGLAIVWVLIPLLTFLLNFFAVKYIQAKVRTETSAVKGAVITVRVQLKNRSILPVAKAYCKIEVKNKLTGQSSQRILPLSAAPRGKTEGTVSVRSQYCGYLDIAVPAVYLMDWFGFLPVRVRQDAKAHVSVLPDTFAPNVFLNLSLAEKEDAQSWSPVKKGNDQSELFALREYVAGDSIKHIHWKMTAKKGQVIVKEASLPIEKSLLLYWDKNTREATAAEMDAMAECVASVGQAILSQGTPFVLGWTEGKSQVLENIDTDEQLLQAIPRMLKYGADVSKARVQQEECAIYSKVIYFAGTLSEEAERFPCDDTTLLLCDKNVSAAMPKIITFGADTYIEDLDFIEL